jgi:hypothetical protein
MDAGDKSSKRQQHQKRQASGSRRQRQLNIRQKHNVHRDQKSHPMEGLRPYHPEAGFWVVNMKPSRRYADKPNRLSNRQRHFRRDQIGRLRCVEQ